MLEFRLSEHITLKLEHNHTIIYVDNERFDQCKRILFTNPQNNERQNQINSIDEAVNILRADPPMDHRPKDLIITPEMEFWAHCSNLQAWIENDYDTRLLHSNLAFPLLIELAEVGDPLAKKVFKDELARLFESGYPSVVTYLLTEGYLGYLNKEERRVLIKKIPHILNVIERMPGNISSIVLNSCLIQFLDSFNEEKQSVFIRRHLPEFLNVIEKKPGSLIQLLDSFNKEEQSFFYNQLLPEILNDIDFFEIEDEFEYRYGAFLRLFAIAVETRCIEELLPTFFKHINKSYIIYKQELYDEYQVFSDLFVIAKRKGWVTKFFPSILKNIGIISDDSQCDVFIYLLNIVKEKGWVQDYFPVFLDSVNKFSNSDQYNVFSDLYWVAFDEGWIEEYLPSFLESIGNFSSYNQYKALLLLLDTLSPNHLYSHKDFRENNKRWPTVKELLLINEKKKLESYRKLIYAVGSTNLMKKMFPTLLEIIVRELPNDDQLSAFEKLIDSIRDTSLLNKSYSQIEPIFITLLETFDKSLKEYEEAIERGVFDELYEKGEEEEEYYIIRIYEREKGREAERKDAYDYMLKQKMRLIKIAKENDWIERLLPSFLKNMELLEYSNEDIFCDIIEYMKEKGSFEEYFPIFFEAIDYIASSEREYVFETLVKVWRELGLSKKYFINFVNIIGKLGWRDYSCFNTLVQIAEEMSSTKEFFPVLSKAIGAMENQYDAFFKLLDIAREHGLTPEYFPFLLEAVKHLDEYKYQFFLALCDAAKEMGLMKNYYAEIKELFLALLDDINFIDDEKKFGAFTDLNQGIDGTLLMEELYSLIEAQFCNLIPIYDNLSDGHKENVFYDLDRLPMNTKLMRNHFPALLGVIDRLQGDTKYYAFYCLLGSIKDTGLFDLHFPHIDTFYLELLNNIIDLPIEESHKAIYHMVQLFKENEKWLKYLSLLRNQYIAIIYQFNKLPESTKNLEYHNLISVIEDTDLENDIDIKKWKEKYESN